MEDNKTYHSPEKLEELNKELYSRDFTEKEQPRSGFSKQKMDVESFWAPPPLQVKKEKRFAGSFFKKILIFAIIFFVISLSLALYIFFRGLNVISADKVNITFIGPVSIAAGTELDYTVAIANDNESELVNPVLYIDYPDGTKSATDLTQDLAHTTENLDDLPAGGSEQRTEKAVLFGQQNDQKEITVTLQYGIKNSTAVFRKEKEYDLKISSSPLTLAVSNPAEVVSNDDLIFTVNVTSNSNSALHNILLTASYPFGFDFIDSTPTTTYDTNGWFIPVLNPGQTETFSIHGRLEGEEGDERAFRFDIGAQSATDPKVIATDYLSSVEPVTINKPSIDAHLSFNGSTADNYAVLPNSMVGGHIDFTNELPVNLIDANVGVYLGGNAINLATANPTFGFYQSAKSELIWDKTTLPALAVVNPGQTISLDFSFNTLSAAQLAAINNGSVSVAVVISGTRTDATTTASLVSVSMNRTVKIQSKVNLSSQVVRSTGPFTDTGPVPPVVGQKTTYTVVWDISNTSNLIGSTKVTATLPNYVLWLGAVSPSTENVTWDPEKDQITWNVGNVPPSTAGTPDRHVAFQIAFTPSVSQVNTVPTLVTTPSLSGIDSFTNAAVSFTTPSLTTDLSADPGFNSSSGIVVEQ